MGSADVWSEIASWYDDLLQAGSGPHETALAALQALLPERLSGSVIDIGCGQGLATRALAERGAPSVVGIDGASHMLELAKERTEPSRRITYRLDDAERLATCEDACFDGAVCQLALMDIADFRAAFASIRRVLRAGWWFVFVIGHPCFLSPDAAVVTDNGHEGCLVTRYFEEEFWRSGNPHGIRGRAGNYHRPLSAYLNGLLEAEFRLDRVLEPRATALLAEQQPLYQQVPIFFAARAIAGDGRARAQR